MKSAQKVNTKRIILIEIVSSKFIIPGTEMCANIIFIRKKKNLKIKKNK